MKALRNFGLFAVVVVLAGLTAHAQSGCTDSPEAPTDILLLVGTVGLFQGSRLFQRLRNKSR